MSSSQIAENYQLKWHSHLTNLNSSVATLFRNDKFADVLLFTSQMDGGCGIPAHKIILSSCSHYFAQVFDANPSPPNAMLYIVLPAEISRRSIQILIQYMYSGEATVSNDILNEVLHGGELLKIRGLCRNKQAHLNSTVNESSTLQYAPAEPACDKTYDHHASDRMSSNAIIKESPVIVTTPHTANASVVHKPQSATSSSSATISGIGLCPTDQEIAKRSSMSYGLKSTRNHCTYNSPTTPLHLKASHGELGHMAPPVPSTTSAHIHSPDGAVNNSMIVKKESMAINAMADDLVSVPASHYGLVSLQIAAAVKKAQQISEKRCSNNTPHLYSKSHIPNTVPNNHDSTNSAEMLTKHIENGNNTAATITSTSTNSSYVRRYSDDYYAKDDLAGASHLHHQQQVDYSRKVDKEQQPPPQPKQPRTNSTVNFDKNPSPMQVTQMPDELHMMDIKQEPVEWSDFEHDNPTLSKSIEVTVKPEMIYAKTNADDDAMEQHEAIYSPLTCELCSETFTIPAEWVRHIDSHSDNAHCVPKKRKHIESTALSENIAALRCDLCEMYFVTPAEWVRHVQNHSETELALSNNNASLRQSGSSAVSHRSSRPPSQHIENTKYGHSQANSHR